MTDIERLKEIFRETKYAPFECMKPEVNLAVQFNDYSLDFIVKELLAKGVLVPPCKEGDTVYRIVKACESNDGRSEFYRPTPEFSENCPCFEQDYDGEYCKAAKDYNKKWYCSLNLNVICSKCIERFAIQKEKFTYSMMKSVFNAPMFDKNTTLDNTYFLSEEEAKRELETHIQIYKGYLEAKSKDNAKTE